MAHFNILTMKSNTIRKQAEQFCVNNNYESALSTALSLSGNEFTNFVKDKSNKWFVNSSFCFSISKNESLMSRLLDLSRADEVLFKHCNQDGWWHNMDQPIHLNNKPAA